MITCIFTPRMGGGRHHAGQHSGDDHLVDPSGSLSAHVRQSSSSSTTSTSSRQPSPTRHHHSTPSSVPPLHHAPHMHSHAHVSSPLSPPPPLPSHTLPAPHHDRVLEDTDPTTHVAGHMSGVGEVIGDLDHDARRLCDVIVRVCEHVRTISVYFSVSAIVFFLLSFLMPRHCLPILLCLCSPAHSACVVRPLSFSSS